MKSTIIAAVAALAPFAHAQVDCSGYMISTQSSYSTTCTGDSTNSNNLHYWPVDVPATYCHGWEASDQGGNKQKFSANSMKCSPDSTIFYYTLYHGVIDCGASTKPNKVEQLNFTSTCEKGDNNMYGQALDMSCCDTRSANFAKCKKSLPTVEFPSNLMNPKQYKNGELCLHSSNKTSSATTDIPTTKKPANTTTVAPPTTAKPVTTPAPSSAASIALGTLSLLAAISLSM